MRISFSSILRWIAVSSLVAVWGALNIDLGATLFALQQANPIKVFLYLPLLILVVWLLRALRWGLIIQAAGVSIDPLRVYLSTAVSLGLAVVTPAQSGEVLKIKHVVDAEQLRFLSAAGGFAAERFYDITILL